MELLKNIKKNTIILVLMTVLILYIVLRKDMTSIIDDFYKLDYKYILIALILYFIYIFLHSYVVYKTVNKKEKFSLRESFKHNMIAQFFNGITPFSTGGQPMEIYMLTEHDISASKATNYIMQNFVFYQIALVLFGFIAVLINSQMHLFPKINFLKEIVILGFIINTLIAIVILVFSLSKTMATKLVKGSINVLYKMHIIKNKEKQEKIWNERLEEYNECADELKKRKELFALGVLLNFLGLACLYAIPLFICYALHDFNNMSLVSAVVSSAYVMVASSFVPIPGASGGIEYSFTQFFGNFLSTGKTSSALLIWRFITYYFGMIVGSILFNFDKEKEER